MPHSGDISEGQFPSLCRATIERRGILGIRDAARINVYLGPIWLLILPPKKPATIVTLAPTMFYLVDDRNVRRMAAASTETEHCAV
jgi:hypothetical protein